MKKNLLEFALGRLEIIQERSDSKGEKELLVKVKWQEADIVNENNRRYGKGLLEREIKRVQAEIDSGKKTIWGHSLHPPDGLGKAEDISHKWEKIWMENDGTCYGEITLLSTEAGKNIQTLVKAGKLGLSSRGFGSFTEKEEMINGKMTKFKDINDDYKMETPGDFVVAPSVIGAGNLTEEIIDLESQLNGALIPKNKKKGFSLERLEEIMLSFFQRDKNFRGSFNDWKEKYSLPIYAKNMVEQGLFETTEEALRAINEGVEKREPRKKVLPKDFIFEAQIAGANPVEMAKRINAGIDKEIAEAKIDLTVEERVRALDEAHMAGIDIHNSEVRKKILLAAKKQKGGTIERPESLTESEKKILLAGEKRTAGIGSILCIEPKKK